MGPLGLRSRANVARLLVLRMPERIHVYPALLRQYVSRLLDLLAVEPALSEVVTEGIRRNRLRLREPVADRQKVEGGLRLGPVDQVHDAMDVAPLFEACRPSSKRLFLQRREQGRKRASALALSGPHREITLGVMCRKARRSWGDCRQPSSDSVNSRLSCSPAAWAR